MRRTVQELIDRLDESLHAQADWFLRVRAAERIDGKRPTEEEARMQTRIEMHNRGVADPEIIRWRLRALLADLDDGDDVPSEA